MSPKKKATRVDNIRIQNEKRRAAEKKTRRSEEKKHSTSGESAKPDMTDSPNGDQGGR
jgi:hypothetical protein